MSYQSACFVKLLKYLQAFAASCLAGKGTSLQKTAQ